MERYKKVKERWLIIEPSISRNIVSSDEVLTSFSVLHSEEAEFLINKATQTDDDGQELQPMKERLAVLKAELFILQNKILNFLTNPSYLIYKSELLSTRVIKRPTAQTKIIKI